MNMSSKRSTILRCGALFLLSGVAFSNVGCDSLTARDRLFFTVKGKDLEVTFCDRGASIYSIKYKDNFVTYHPKDKDTFLKNDYYYGKALGRVAGRIKDGKLNVEGKDYQLDINEKDKYYKNNNIHGGKDSITTRNFKRYITETKDAITVSFSYLSPAMESGFPESVDCRYTYTVHKDENKIELDIKGTPSGTTPLNLSNHPYFRLGNSGDILTHTLEMPNVQSLAEFDMHEDKRCDQTVIGTIPITKSDVIPWDFRESSFIYKKIYAAAAADLTSGGFDHIWKFSSGNCRVKLWNIATNIGLDVSSDADAVIMYANCYPHTDDEMNPEGKDSLYAGITVEPVKFYTRDHLEVLNCTPDDPFTRHIQYTFTDGYPW